jgi:hypothetical protein
VRSQRSWDRVQGRGSREGLCRAIVRVTNHELALVVPRREAKYEGDDPSPEDISGRYFTQVGHQAGTMGLAYPLIRNY